MPVINISIENKIAEADGTLYVCDNSDFVAKFAFDTEWEAYENKTARFVYNNSYVDVVFTGNECPVPIISGTYFFNIGVYAGNLHTTTPARVPCKKSIRCGNEPESSASQEVRNEFLGVLDKRTGDLADLTTEAKDTLVAAINELALSSGAGSMSLRVADGYIQYSTDSGMTWTNLIAVADLKGADGSQGPKGEPGAKGDPGVPGKDGSDATVTAANIAGALGYTPAAPGDIPVVPAAEISANTAARHSHTNKGVLDGITGQVTADKVNGPDHTTDLVQYGAFKIAANQLTQQIIKQIPTVPTALKNPNALTIKIGGTTVTYDGSAAKTVEIADGSEVSY